MPFYFRRVFYQWDLGWWNGRGSEFRSWISFSMALEAIFYDLKDDGLESAGS